MRKLLALLLLLPCAVANATLTVTLRGTQADASAVSTHTITPSSTLAAGTMGVVVCAYSNAGGGGATSNPVASFNDSAGNTWTLRVNQNYDPGAANAGATNAIYTASISTQVTTSGSVAPTTGSSCIAALRLYEVSTTASGVAYSTSGTNTGATGTAVSLVTGSLTSGNAVICFCNWLANADPTYDSDTSNGSWAAGGRTGVAQPRSCGVQSKVVTATGTQTWNLTITSVAHNESWVEISELTSAVKTVQGLTKSAVKTVGGLAVAAVKAWQGLQ